MAYRGSKQSEDPLWRLLKNGLAVGAELQRRNIKVGIRCAVCNREETTLHWFWRCPFAKECWSLVLETRGNGCDFIPPKHIDSQANLSLWLLDWFGRQEGEKAVMIMTLYHMWLARNACRDG